jgi:hypothetical protein
VKSLLINLAIFLHERTMYKINLPMYICVVKVGKIYM